MQVGRMASDCRDRWRNHLLEKDKRNMGTVVFVLSMFSTLILVCDPGQWSKEEEEELKQVVTELTHQRGQDVGATDTDVFWTQVSAKMGYKRSRQQCRGKWYTDCYCCSTLVELALTVH
jgi:hypothetical protein